MTAHPNATGGFAHPLNGLKNHTPFGGIRYGADSPILEAMEQTFLVFPSGSTGVALLLLRASVSLSLINPPYSRIPPQSLSMLACDLVALAIFVGLYTRISAMMGVIAIVGTLALLGAMPSVDWVIHALPAIALVMTGPGAMAIDARLYGRRTVHIPR